MPQVGQVLNDRYQLQQRLGRDASRQTWLAIDLEARTQKTGGGEIISPQS